MRLNDQRNTQVFSPRAEQLLKHWKVAVFMNDTSQLHLVQRLRSTQLSSTGGKPPSETRM